MTAYPGQTLTRTTLGQLCAALWDSQSRTVEIQPGIKPGSVVTPLALRCSALNRCATTLHVDLRGLNRYNIWNTVLILSCAPSNISVLDTNRCPWHIFCLAHSPSEWHTYTIHVSLVSSLKKYSLTCLLHFIYTD